MERRAVRFFTAVLIIAVSVFVFVFAMCCSSTAVGRTDASYEKRAEQILKKMTLSQKAGQMIFYSGRMKNPQKKLKAGKYGGYLMYAADFKGSTPKKTRKKLARYQKYSRKYSGVGMFIGVDEEGGIVNRVSIWKKFRKSPFRSPKTLYKAGGMKKVRKDALSKSGFLKALGINTNFAPVVDVPYKSGNYIYARAVSIKPKKTCTYARTVVCAMNSRKIVSVVKHFPGYGGNGDTHTNMVRDKRSLKTLKKRDLKPFQAAIDRNCSMIMVSHNIVKAFDKKRPATISPAVHRYLRKNMGYRGVVITDSMGMAGVKKYAKDNGSLAVKAVKAGNDMICTPYGSASRKAIIKAVKSGKISKKRVNASVKRILVLKLRMGIIK